MCPTRSGCSSQLAVSEEHGLDLQDLAMCPGILSLPLAPPLGTIFLFALCAWGKFKILVIVEWSVSALTLCKLESQVLPQALGLCVRLGLPQETIPIHSCTYS